MSGKLKIVAVLAIIACNFWFWESVIHPPTLRLAPLKPGASRKVPKEDKPNYKPLLLPVIFAAVTVLTIDAFRRTYEGRRGRALGLAIGGYFSLGLGSIIYYLRWGIQRIRSPAEVYGEKFCSRCLANSSYNSARVNFMHGAAGFALMGDEDRCLDCKSRVKTLWLIFLMPLIPFGSYRVIPVGPGEYLSRRTKLSWRQVTLGYLVVAIAGGAVLVWIIVEAWKK